MKKDGFLLVDKQFGDTSNHELRVIKKILNQKKIGHAGTLDPYATGLLIVLLGRCTKAAQYINQFTKTYEFELSLGVETSTGDREGDPTKEMPVEEYSEQDLKDTLKGFVGITEQVPPIFSALKFKGKPYYHYARKGITIPIASKKIDIKLIKLISYKDNLINIRVSCGSGTYIRTLAQDIAITLGTVGHASAIKRISIGSLHIRDAIILKGINSGLIKNSVKPVAHIFDDYPKVKLDIKSGIMFAQGQSVSFNLNKESNETIISVLDADNSFIGLGRYIPGLLLKPVKIFK